MPTPTPIKTWIVSPNNRITFVSLLDTMQRYLFGVKEFLKTNGFTVKGSASAGTGAMDGVDRWTTSANVTPRATIAGASQAWVVLTNGGGVDIAFCYQGSTDDIVRISYSPGGLYVAAGTPQNQPTATDEVLDHLATSSTINTTASNDRLWNAWTTSDRKMVRVAIARAGTWIPALSVSGKAWCIEQYAPAMVSPWLGAPSATPTWMLSIGSANAIPNGSQAGRTRITGPTGSQLIDVYWGMESIPLSATTGNYPISFGNERPELQGGAGYPNFPLGLWSQLGGASGKIGNTIDQYTSRNAGDTAGDTYGTKAWVNMTGYLGTAGGGGLWPWDGVTTPVMT